MDSQNSTPATIGRDWHLLPREILEVIGKKVTSLADYIRFRAVCHPWQNACSSRPDHLPLQLPWLMLPYHSDGNNDSNRFFYDLAASKFHKLDLPETCGVSICGSSHGWFVLQKGQVVSLLNPITHATISLPLFSGPPFPIGIGLVPFVRSDAANFLLDQHAISPTDNLKVCKAILTSSPRDPSCIVFVSTNSIWSLAFCKIGDKYWTVIEFECDWPWIICDITYSDGFLYAINPFATVTVYNLDNFSRTSFDSGIYLGGVLVEGVSRDILFIYDRPIYYVNGNLKEIVHTVYKLSNNGEPKWIQVKDVGQNVLFLGKQNALSLSCANLQLPEWANCLCYHSVRTMQCDIRWCNHNIKLARLDDDVGTVTDIIGDLRPFQENEHWQMSLWLTPSLL